MALYNLMENLVSKSLTSFSQWVLIIFLLKALYRLPASRRKTFIKIKVGLSNEMFP